MENEICFRCGALKKDIRRPGHYYVCNVWGKHYGNHVFKIRAKYKLNDKN